MLGWLERVPLPRPGTGGLLGRRAGVAALCLAAAAGLAVAVVAAGQARSELGRGPTAAERSAAVAKAVALRWRAWPAGQIFPARLRYGPPGHPAQDQAALRIGISPQTGCAAGLDPVAAAAAARRGCQAVLRATYTDPLQGIVWTVGVVAFRGPGDAASFVRSLAGSQPLTSRPPAAPVQARAGAGTGPAAVLHGYLRSLPPARSPVGTLVIRGPAGGVRALPVPQSAAALFIDRARQLVTGWQQGPYAVLATAGYADGRPAGYGLEQRISIFRPAGQLASDVLAPLAVPVTVRCQSPGWRC